MPLRTAIWVSVLKTPGGSGYINGLLAGGSKVSVMNIWILVTLIVTVLAIATFKSIASGPSANEAMISIRVAQRELFDAQWAYQEPTPTAVNDAEETLDIAFKALDNKRYSEAILLAHKTNELLRTLGGQNWL